MNRENKDIDLKRRGLTIVLEKPAFEEKKTEILIVDDEEPLRKMLTEMLQAEGYAVKNAASADAAIPLIKQEKFELILSDVMMPGTSGLELLDQAKEISPLTEFIIMTGFPKVSAAVAAMKAGAFDYLSKPFDSKEIKSKVREAMENARISKAKKLDETNELNRKKSRKLAGFEIIRTLGEGAMGIVFLVERKVNKKPVQFAMKIIKSEGEDGKTEKTERFFKEAKAASDLDHPNIVQILEHGYAREENIPYLVMEYFKSDTLHNLVIGNKRPDFETSIKIIIQIAEALHVAHLAGVVHRDVKPDNILINESFAAKLTDFGVARLPGSRQTDAMKMIGTPYYIAPEAFSSSKVDFRADIYSLGTVAYELFLGVRTFEEDIISVLGYKVQNENPVEPIKLNKKFPVNLQAVLEKMLMKDPSKRYRSASYAAADLRQVLEEGTKHKTFLGSQKWDTL